MQFRVGAILRLLEKVYAAPEYAQSTLPILGVYLVNYNRDKTGINPVTMTEIHQWSFILLHGWFQK